MSLNYDVVIIGSGPAGVAAAYSLRRRGIQRVAIIEREADAGGVPRHCQHPTFGVLAFKRPMKGNQFAKKIVAQLGDTPIFTRSTVTQLHPNGHLTISTPDGLVEAQAKRVLIATGVRETPRHPRLVSGLRPQGIITAGALQQFVYLNGKKPCRNPVIVGSELVSFSALWTLKNAGVKAQAMIESGDRILAFKPATLFAKAMGTPVFLNSQITEIGGLERVEYVVVESAGKTHKIMCDSVIFTGQFVGENTLIRKSHLDYDAATGKPVTDQRGRCSDTSYYAAGNMLHPADMGDQCYQEGLWVGEQIADDLLANHHQQQLKETQRLPVHLDDKICFSVPACIDINDNSINKINFNIKVEHPVNGTIKVMAGSTLLYEKHHRGLPTRRILLKNIDLTKIQRDATEISIAVV
ncbi:FAD-dependent oxidoreductase [Providencia rettgeri]|uniref:NAD(P)/FAD-dependent oxidoreductase n=1 Tax=Providencia TaxID=586 RepID=UPI00141944D6|nr:MULTISPECIES: FAD-dependent oxidoreductase [Providencia]EJD6368207.1 FAD-dependent oxidoreductase [Providencia rettgeri]EJD6372405.1 FAD-dependent oxidoreductase [Providencia rettgeri]ELR5030120.1 FAD-dependent oxidoreductase [Providencia rettgeri]ELR5128625.1 FAD-dependent oxidoreductase [Providencia rettgeri]ELR5159657.1 FAD-dependent oxidoreductase [Providencia rettgeri]